MAKPPTPAADDPAAVSVTDDVRPVAKLSADPQNARRHSEQQIAQIVHSIEEFGFIHRVVIQPDGIVIGGHATLEALRRLGRETAEVRVVSGLSRAQVLKLSLALNRIPENSDWDDDILRDVIGDIRDAGENVLDIGFSGAQVDRLLKEPEEIAVKEVETGPVDDEFWISIRGPLARQAEALVALEAAMKPFAGVTVDVGMIAVG